MRSDPAVISRRPGRLTTTVVAALLTLALALVAPASGPSRGGAHDFVSVHLIFPHHHGSHPESDARVADDLADDDVLRALGQPAYSSPGPLADAASLASKSLVMAGLLFVLAQVAHRLSIGPRVPVPRPRWDAVPLQPPR
jgi:hypothetical protein